MIARVVGHWVALSAAQATDPTIVAVVVQEVTLWAAEATDLTTVEASSLMIVAAVVQGVALLVAEAADPRTVGVISQVVVVLDDRLGLVRAVLLIAGASHLGLMEAGVGHQILMIAGPLVAAVMIAVRDHLGLVRGLTIAGADHLDLTIAGAGHLGRMIAGHDRIRVDHDQVRDPIQVARDHALALIRVDALMSVAGP